MNRYQHNMNERSEPMSSKRILLQHLQCQNCTFICNDRTQGRARHCSRFSCEAVPLLVARIESSLKGPMFGEHWHEQMQLLYFKRGSALIHCNGQSHDLAPNDILIINSNEIHYGTNFSTETLYYILKIDFHELFLHQKNLEKIPYIKALMENRLLFQYKIHNDRTFNRLVEGILHECEQQAAGYELSVQANLIHIASHLLRYYQRKVLPVNHNQQNVDQLRSALAYLEAHYQENITLDFLADIAAMSPQHFCRLFKKLTGRRPMDYINLLRVNKAASLLNDQKLNISEIAAEVGFNDTNYFSRVFKKYQAMSPTQFQKKII